MNARRSVRVALVAALFLLAACSRPTAYPDESDAGGRRSSTEPAEPALTPEVTGTEVIAFDPSSIPVDPDAPVAPARCRVSEVVPRPGAYGCTTDAGAAYDPCFVVSGSQLGCRPNPVAQRWSAIVAANAPLPDPAAPALDPITFFVNLGPAFPPCSRIEPTRPLAAYEVQYQCEAPGAVLVGELDQSTSPFTAQYATTNSAGDAITYGPEAAPVETAWVW